MYVGFTWCLYQGAALPQAQTCPTKGQQVSQRRFMRKYGRKHFIRDPRWNAMRPGQQLLSLTLAHRADAPA